MLLHQFKHLNRAVISANTLDFTLENKFLSMLQQERYFSSPKSSFLAQKRFSLQKCTRVSNRRDTDFRLFIILGDESVNLVTLCGQAKSFHFMLNDFIE